MKALLTATLLPAASMAGTATSADYANISAGVNAAGGLSATQPGGGSYLQSSCSAPVGGLTAFTDTLNRSGFAAQIYDAVGLKLITDPAFVAERSTIHLHAAQLLDDGTTLELRPGSVGFTFLAGPLDRVISAEGDAVVENVYQDTTAIVSARFEATSLSLAFTVHDVLPDNFGSYAFDGLPDWWQVQYFGLDNADAAPANDEDADGTDNTAEYNAGTDPLDGASSFLATMSGGIRARRIAFASVSGRSYTLEISDTLAVGSWSALQGPVAGTGGELQFHLSADGGIRRRFYRVTVSPDP